MSGRLIEDRGRFLEEVVFLRDNVIFQGTVGFEVMRPFHSEAGDIALVNFGFVPGGSDRSVLPSVPALTEVDKLSGRAYISEWASDAGIDLYTGWPRITPTQSPLANGNIAQLPLLTLYRPFRRQPPRRAPTILAAHGDERRETSRLRSSMVLNGGGSTDIIYRIYMEAVQGAAGRSSAHATKEIDGHERFDAE